MKKASYIFEIMREHLHSKKFLEVSRINPCDFCRNRFFKCYTIALFILNLLKKSIPKEMISFCEYCEINEVSRSAVTQARAKLSSEAFIYLNDILTKEFYTDNSFKTLNGLIVTAIDGTTLQLPINSPEIIRKYGFASNQTETQVPMARASHLYDVLNGITIDANISPYTTGERDIAIQHFEKLRSNWDIEFLQKILVIFDRGYPSLPFIVYLLKCGINFLMRSNNQFLKEVNDVVKAGKRDTIIRISLNRATRAAKTELRQLFPDIDMNEVISLRVVIVTLSTGEEEILITSLLDKQQYPYKMFRELYFNRWGIEENYKFHKVTLEIENFSGKSCLAVEQDFHANILASNVRRLLALEADNEINESRENFPHGNTRKYIYEINKNVSMEKLKNDFVAILLNPKEDMEKFCIKVKKTMKRNLVPIRPGRCFKRLRRHPNHKYHMNLR